VNTESEKKVDTQVIFTGNIFLFHTFDIGEDIALDAVSSDTTIKKIPYQLSKYFKNYHTPLAIELPRPHATSHWTSCMLHFFGAFSLTYSIPFHDTLSNLHKDFNKLIDHYYEKSMLDARVVYNKIAPYTSQANFFQMSSLYIVIQIDPQPGVTPDHLRQQFGNLVASTLRFEPDLLSELQKNEMWNASLGYFRGNVVIIDQECAFMYDDEFEDILALFEFANIQHLELKFFDKLLDQQLNKIYEHKIKPLPLKAYLPFFGNAFFDPVGHLGRLRAEIAVITERLEHSVKLANEVYLTEIYDRLVEQLDIASWRSAIEKKLEIMHDIQSVYQHKIDATREDLLSVLIIILIFIELVIGMLSYLK
jgi:hypothetical protein